MPNFYVGVPDSKLKNWLKDREYIMAADEGEAVGLAAGYYLATHETPTVFLSADGFMNALNPLTSLIIPYEIPIHFIVGTGRSEPQHKVASDTLEALTKLYEQRTITYEFVR